MQTIELEYDPRLHQLEVHKSLRRFNVLVCHRRFGKTVLCINQLIASALRSQKQRPRFAYISPFYRQSKAIAWDYLKHYTSPIPGVRFNESELRVDLPNGSRITLYGADNYDSLRGIYLDGVVLDEFAQMPMKAWTEVIRPALSDRQGWAIFIGTPKGHNAFYDLYRNAKDQQDWFAGMYKASETKVIPQYELDSVRKDLTEDEYNQEFECSFEAAIQGAYYAEQMKAARDPRRMRLCKVPHDADLPVFTSWDLGFDDATAIIFYQKLGKEVRIIDYEEHNGESLAFYATLLGQKGYSYGMHFLPHDASHKELGTGKSIEEQLWELGITQTTVVPRVSIDSGIQAVRSLFPSLWIDNSNERTKHFIECITQYHKEFDEDRKIFRSKPEHDWASHACFTGDTNVLTRNGMQRIMDLPQSGSVLTLCGWKPYHSPRITQRNAPLVEVAFSDGTSVKCTPEHFFLTDKGWRYAKDLTKGTPIRSSLIPSPNTLTVGSIGSGPAMFTTPEEARSFTGTFGLLRSVLSRLIATFTTRTRTPRTMLSATLNVSQQANTSQEPGTSPTSPIEGSAHLHERELLSGTDQRPDDSGIDDMRRGQRPGQNGSGKQKSATIAESSSKPLFERDELASGSAQAIARPLFIEGVRRLGESEDVWCLSVPGTRHFSLHNGAIVHNCDALRYLALGFSEEYVYDDDEPSTRRQFGGNLG